MSRGLLVQALCRTGKRRFPSDAAAREEIARLRESFQGDPARMPHRAYRCHHCEGFHLTSMKRGG